MNGNSFVYDLAEDLKPENGVKAKCIVQFRTSGKYNGEYGFDWPRGGDSGRKGDTWYVDIIGRYRDAEGRLHQVYPDRDGVIRGFFVKSVAEYDKFAASQYRRHMIVWKKKTGSKNWVYCVPIMTLLKEREALLTLKVEVIEKAVEIKYKYNETFFELSKTDIPILDKGKHTLADELTIKCIEEFDEDQTIAVIAKNEDGEELLAGRLIIKANDKAHQKYINIVMIRVCSDLGSGVTIANISSNRLKRLNKYFDQCYVTTNVIYEKLDVTSSLQRITVFKQFANGINIDDSKVAEPLFIELNKMFNTDHPTLKDYYKIYLINQPANGLYGQARKIGSKEVVVFQEGLEDTTCAHELLHALGLYHSFDNDSKYTFEEYKTDNIMDYSDMNPYNISIIAMWRFQWEKVSRGL